jgi:hypothetical protein
MNCWYLPPSNQVIPSLSDSNPIQLKTLESCLFLIPCPHIKFSAYPLASTLNYSQNLTTFTTTTFVQPASCLSCYYSGLLLDSLLQSTLLCIIFSTQ